MNLTVPCFRRTTEWLELTLNPDLVGPLPTELGQLSALSTSRTTSSFYYAEHYGYPPHPFLLYCLLQSFWVSADWEERKEVCPPN